MKMVGRVKWFNSFNGYGYLETRSCCHILVRCPSIENGYAVLDLKENEQVEFDVRESFNGPYAANVQRTGKKPRKYSMFYRNTGENRTTA